MKSNRRKFLELTGGSLATLTLSSCRIPSPDKAETEPLAAAFSELNEAAALGVTPDEFDRALPYVMGVYREAQAKLRPMLLREDLEMAVRFSARKER
ncbi:MAG: hypothetical protein HY646_04540 [Acidobacteria bacterium]|nr:hypothetical protein [Acidobacteriota bacterium]